MNSIPKSSFLRGALIFWAVLLTSAGVMWLLSSDARRQIDNLAVASSDASQWQVSQTEIEYLALLNAARAAATGGASLKELRRRFDVFYSRMQTNKTSEAFESLRDIPRVSEAFDNIQLALDATVPAIDSGDTQLMDALPLVTSRLASIQGDLRAISLAGVREFAKRSKSLRLQVYDALTDLGWIALGLLIVLLGVVGVLLASMRVSQHKTAEVARTQDRLQAIISTSIDAVVVFDRSGEILDFNGAAECIFGYARDEAIGSDVDRLIILDRAAPSSVRKLIGKGLIRLDARKSDGSAFPVEVSVEAAKSEQGEIDVAYFRDISKRVANEQELVEARDKALAGEKAKADLLAVMSHEMRTPLNGVLGTIQLLVDTNLNAAQKKYVGVMETSGRLLLEHVNNVLDISRVDAGAVEASQQEFDVCTLVEGVIEGLKGQASDRGNALKVTSIGEPTCPVVGDEARVRQILFNLVGNAIKFTENGIVTVEIEDHPDEDQVEFRVIDTGIGIDEKNLDRIFADFVTLDSSYNREVEGTGLGLGIVRRLVALLDGEITVESVVEQGTVFSVLLPLPKASVVSQSAEPELSSRPLEFTNVKVLLVEDNEINRMVARDMLEKLGCSVTDASDGHEGVLLAENFQFDLIFMDISMPKIDGVTAAKAIKSTNGPNHQTPIVAITAHALPEDEARVRDAGMIDIITKPVSLDRLAETLGNTLPVPHDDELSEVLGTETSDRIRGKAIAQLTEGFAQLEEMISDQSSRSDISELAHRLIGTAGLFGLDTTLSELRKLEQSSSTTQVNELKGYVAAARRALN